MTPKTTAAAREVRIQVTAKMDAGVHPKYGRIVVGRTYTINEADFSAALFERPAVAAPAELPAASKGRAK